MVTLQLNSQWIHTVISSLLISLVFANEPEKLEIRKPLAVAPANIDVKIPRIMHHIYWQWDKSKKVNTERIDKWGVCRKTCIDKTPGYEYILWDDVMIEDLIMKHYHWIMPMYKSYDYEVQRSDVARYLILHHMGGIYLDMDDCCRMSMEPLVSDMEKKGQTALLPRALPWGTGNDILVSTQGNDFMSYAIYHLLCTNKRYVIPYTTVLMSTGTLYLSARRKEYRVMYPEFKFRILGVEERANKYIFREGGSTWHRIDGDIIFHVYSHWLIYTIFGVVLVSVLVVTCCRRERRIRCLARLRGKTLPHPTKLSYA